MEKIELGDMLERYFKPAIGQVPIIIVDTSFIIDLEEKARCVTTRASGDVAVALFQDLAKIVQKVVVPEKIMGEIKRHKTSCFKNGRPEISEKLHSLLGDYSKKSSHLTKEAEKFFKWDRGYREIWDEIKDLSWDIYCRLKDGKKDKKTNRDPISSNDLALIDASLKLALRASANLHGRISQMGDVPGALKGCYRIAVLSADSHIYKTITHFLHDPQGIRYRDYLVAINTREHL